MPCAFVPQRATPHQAQRCQFARPEPELIQFDNRLWCKFHLPMGTDGIGSPKANWTQQELDEFNQEIFDHIKDKNRENQLVNLAGTIFPYEISFESSHRPVPIKSISFAETRFFDRTFFTDVHFPGEVTFDGAQFHEDVDFRRVIFEKGVTFKGALFTQEAAFYQTKFKTRSSFAACSFFDGIFADAVFTGGADFADTIFAGEAAFGATMFNGHALFDRVVFQSASGFGKARFGGASFRSAVFKDSIGFREATFCTADFREAQFCQDADFTKARFVGSVQFGNARFVGAAVFECADFKADTDFSESVWAAGDASFRKTRFREKCNFQNVEFSNQVWFTNAIFIGETCFSSTKFKGGADFSVSEDKLQVSGPYGPMVFKDAHFFKSVRFHNRHFKNTTRFDGANFSSAPEFHGCRLHQDTVFPRERNFTDTEDSDAARAYRTLKYAMASVHARDEEAKFHGLEQRSLRYDRATPVSVRLFSDLYCYSSNYGQSLLRPVIALVLTFSVSWVVYVLYLSTNDLSHPAITPFSIQGEAIRELATGASGWGSRWGSRNVTDAFWFACQQVFLPFDVFRVKPIPSGGDVPRVFYETPLCLKLIAAAQSLISLSLATLFLLSLRRRFKLG
jgi:uncharacterized protein YjbI with pentapeptide repeats